MAKHPIRSRRAFSLVELLVVIGIIALLIAMLLPALRLARQSAQRTACAAQLHQIGIALLNYANSNKGSLPAWSGWHTWPLGLPGDQDGPAWTVELIPYIGSPDSPVYQCPSFPAPMRNYFLSAIWSFVNGHNSMKLTDVKMSSRFIISGDTSQPGIYLPPYGSAQPDNRVGMDADLTDEGEPCLAFPGQGGFLMHRGGNNVLFDDWHVQCFPAFDRGAMTFDPTAMKSWDEVRSEQRAQP